MADFKLVSNFQPSGDQPEAISQLVDGLSKNTKFQTLKGVTGSGKTFTIANVIEKINKPTLVLAHNKTLAVINVDAMGNTYGRTKDIIIVGKGNSNIDQIVESAAKQDKKYVEADAEPEGFVDVHLPAPPHPVQPAEDLRAPQPRRAGAARDQDSGLGAAAQRALAGREHLFHELARWS